MEPTESVSWVVLAISLLMTGFMIWCAYRTAKAGQWVLFVLGFFCGIAWVIGALMSSGGSGKADGFLMSRRRGYQARPDGGPGAGQIPAAQQREDGRCPQCGKRDVPSSGRCPACGYFLGM